MVKSIAIESSDGISLRRVIDSRTRGEYRNPLFIHQKFLLSSSMIPSALLPFRENLRSERENIIDNTYYIILSQIPQRKDISSIIDHGLFENFH